jgi:hypothetical protein
MIEFDVVITNGYVDSDTICKRIETGWNFVVTVPANLVHPYAMPTDKATIFSRYKKLELNETPTTNA